MEHKVYDGFVRLVDSMGDDSSIVQAARVSYGEGTKTISEDRGLIRYLLRNKHTSPFEMVEFKFHIKLPIFIARQWIRHRTASVNEYSGRYSVMKDEFYSPVQNRLKEQSTVNKQSSNDDVIEEAKYNSILINQSCEDSFDNYNTCLEYGVSREIARIVLPLSTYTEWYWKIDLHNLLHFLRLRMDEHAQEEIREYANVIYTIVKEICPLTIEAFDDYITNSVTFSKHEIEILSNIIQKKDFTFENLAKSEKIEFIKKLLKLGIEQ
jgi:thymidylate synthase (FAD)